LEKKFFCIDLSKYRLITIFLNSLPMIFKVTVTYPARRPRWPSYLFRLSSGRGAVDYCSGMGVEWRQNRCRIVV